MVRRLLFFFPSRSFIDAFLLISGLFRVEQVNCINLRYLDESELLRNEVIYLNESIVICKENTVCVQLEEDFYKSVFYNLYRSLYLQCLILSFLIVPYRD